MVTLTLLHPQHYTPLQQWSFDKSAIRVGRASDNHVALDDSRVSRYHLELKVDPATSSWQLVNYGRNGTFLNGLLKSKGQLSHGCLLQLSQGGPILKFELEPTQYPSSLPLAACTHTNNPPGNLFCIRCGQPLVIQRKIRQYQILRTLGQGGMGTTFLAWNSEALQSDDASTTGGRGMIGRPQLVVLKEMNADMAKISKARELFEREAHILKTLNHPGIPKFLDFFTEQNKKYLVMELIQGQDLEKQVHETGPVVMQQAIEWMIQTCAVLDYIHRQNPPIIHRDIKPANLIVRHTNKRIVVLDFGAVKQSGTPLETRIGAEGYTAPEQDLGRPVIQSDLYAIGSTLVFLLTGQSPCKFYCQQNQDYRIQLEGVAIALQLRQVIERTTEPNVSDRYKSARDLMQALAACR